ncbi:ATP-dependent DNA helicase MER3 [Chamberlinius hualienensis]
MSQVSNETETSNSAFLSQNEIAPVNRRKVVFRPPFRLMTQTAQDQNLSTCYDFEVPAINWNSGYGSQKSDRSVYQTEATEVNGQRLHSVTELPERFLPIFKTFRYFNAVQSTVFSDIYNSNKSAVICAPTGSGKTVLLELAIVSLLQRTITIDDNIKIIYMAPIKALCSERWEDWKQKFEPYGLQCVELTGDTEADDYTIFQKANLIFTTPEKWDSATRRWHNSRNLVEMIKLFLIDEIHVVYDESRGATVEAVISRMLTTSACSSNNSGIRFIAISATIPNVEDFANWFESTGKLAVSYKLSDDLRPVKLRKEVLGYYCSEKWTDFKFDLNLNYKLSSVIHTYSDGKPTLVFCSTRKGVVQTASTLSAEFKYRLSTELKEKLIKIANISIKDHKLKEVISCGVGFHHAGLETQDRKTVEQLFTNGSLLVLTSTSTLAMGVNMPAHLVIIKNTSSFVAGSYVEYSSTQILQMIGRAGRPQFDTTATAVIMTKESLKAKYDNFLGGNEVVESQLHKRFAEYINAEVVLGTITDLSVAMKWIQSTFFYIRVLKNPEFYGVTASDNKDKVEAGIKEMCLKELNALHDANIIEMNNNNYCIKSTEYGRLMARFCISLDTTQKFLKLKGSETIIDLISLISTCKELSDILLRTSDKKTLNALNNDKELPTIRYGLEGKIRSREMKINCLIQAAFGCLHIQDLTLNQEIMKIMRIGQRLSKFLYEIVYLNSKQDIKLLVACVTIAKCFSAKLWENSFYISRQLDKIGISMATALVNSGLTTFEKILQTNPRQLELIVNRHPPFGNYIREAVANLPKFDIRVEQSEKYFAGSAEIIVHLILSNHIESKRDGNFHHVVIIGDRDGNVVFKQKLVYKTIFQNCNVWSKQLTVVRAQKGDELTVYLINDHYVGLDTIQKFTPKYNKGGTPKAQPWHISKESKVLVNTIPSDTEVINNEESAMGVYPAELTLRSCNHHCLNKKTCSHECCKTGVIVKSKKMSSQRVKQDIHRTKSSDNKNKSLKLRQTTIDDTSVKRKKLPTVSLDVAAKFNNSTDEPEKILPKEICGVDGRIGLASKLKKFSYQPSVNHFRGSVTNCRNLYSSEPLCKPNFEIFLESDFECDSDDDGHSLQSLNNETNFNNFDEKEMDTIHSNFISEHMIVTEKKVENSFLCASNVYQQKPKIISSENSYVGIGSLDFHDLKRRRSPVKQNFPERENMNIETDNGTAASTFMELFGDVIEI